MFRNLGLHRKTRSSIPAPTTVEGFISTCQQVLDTTTAGTGIYILSCLCPEDSDVVLDLLSIDLSQPHQHKYPAKKRVDVASSSYTDVISRLRAYAKTLPAKVYGRLWLDVAQQWLLTCPMDEAYYKPDESGNDSFCRKLQTDLLESILNIT